jgi:hypothetical protein
MKKDNDGTSQNQVPEINKTEQQGSISYEPLLAITCGKIKSISQIITKAGMSQFKPKIIDEQYFVENYLSDNDIIGFLNYIMELDHEEIVAFIAIINFMNAGVKINSEYPARYGEHYEDLITHYIWPQCEGINEEYAFHTTSELDSFIQDYRHGDIIVDFNAEELLNYLVEETK